MASNSIRITTAATAMALVLATELVGWSLIAWSQMPPLAAIGLVRVAQVTAIVWILHKRETGLAAIGWSPAVWLPGLKKGALWSLMFALFAIAGMAAMHLAGINPFQLIRSPLPTNGWELGLFFLVGGFIAPVAEELFFRGVLYTFFRRWGIICALAVSTAIFVVLHAPHDIPYTQIVGGLVFAMAYETTGNLTVPMTIHCLGNLAIFILSLM